MPAPGRRPGTAVDPDQDTGQAGHNPGNRAASRLSCAVSRVSVLAAIRVPDACRPDGCSQCHHAGPARHIRGAWLARAPASPPRHQDRPVSEARHARTPSPFAGNQGQPSPRAPGPGPATTSVPRRRRAVAHFPWTLRTPGRVKALAGPGKGSMSGKLVDRPGTRHDNRRPSGAWPLTSACGNQAAPPRLAAITASCGAGTRRDSRRCRQLQPARNGKQPRGEQATRRGGGRVARHRRTITIQAVMYATRNDQGTKAGYGHQPMTGRRCPYGGGLGLVVSPVKRAVIVFGRRHGPVQPASWPWRLVKRAVITFDRAACPAHGPAWPATRAASTLASQRPVKPAAAPRKRRNDAAIRPATRA